MGEGTVGEGTVGEGALGEGASTLDRAPGREPGRAKSASARRLDTAAAAVAAAPRLPCRAPGTVWNLGRESLVRDGLVRSGLARERE
ncbi:hypothetical protein [Streptomyces sp. NPDC048442]|uniref:hypothetical protein n=1 Tax=Streptomyces sp. NPDC048442 TaxID=3154823 RepID=UPI0034141F61